MPASRADILRWLANAVEKRARWLVVKCDTFDFRGSAGDQCCYPTYCVTPEDVKKALENGDRTMEVYDLTLSIDSQMAERRAIHPPEGMVIY